MPCRFQLRNFTGSFAKEIVRILAVRLEDAFGVLSRAVLTSDIFLMDLEGEKALQEFIEKFLGAELLVIPVSSLR